MPIEGNIKEIPAQIFDKYYLSSFIIQSDPISGSRVVIEVLPYRIDEDGNRIFALVPPVRLIIPRLFSDKEITEDVELAASVLQTEASIFDSVGKVLKKKGLI